jgi:hypothetical protein
MMLLVFVPGITQADYVAPLHCRVQYSPYAFGYHNNGLVPGGIAYSPYAFRPGSSGLVFEGVRYTPYAFTYRSSGLILDYSYCPVPYAVFSPSCAPDVVCPMCNGVPPCDDKGRQLNGMKNRSRYYPQSRDTVSPAANQAVASAAKDDAVAVIRQHLRAQGLTDVSVNRILRIDNKLVSADFTVAGRNVLIKYWDPAQVESSNTKAAVRPKATEKYKTDWEAFASKYQQDGGEIYVVAASGRTDIVAALSACNSLKPGDAQPTPQTVYAKQ